MGAGEDSMGQGGLGLAPKFWPMKGAKITKASARPRREGCGLRLGFFTFTGEGPDEIRGSGD